MTHTDLKTLQPSSKPNSAFAAPDGVETIAAVDMPVPVFDLAASQFFERAVSIWSDLVRVECVSRDDQAMKASFVATTKLMKFKDDIDFKVLSLEEGRSSFLIYSRSRVGYSDLGTNRKRLAQWLSMLA